MCDFIQITVIVEKYPTRSPTNWRYEVSKTSTSDIFLSRIYFSIMNYLKKPELFAYQSRQQYLMNVLIKEQLRAKSGKAKSAAVKNKSCGPVSRMIS